MCLSVCLCLSAAACLHYCTDPDVTWGVEGDAPSCALLGGFAIDAWVALLWQHNANAKCYRVQACTRSMPSLLSIALQHGNINETLQHVFAMDLLKDYAV